MLNASHFLGLECPDCGEEPAISKTQSSLRDRALLGYHVSCACGRLGLDRPTEAEAVVSWEAGERESGGFSTLAGRDRAREMAPSLPNR